MEKDIIERIVALETKHDAMREDVHDIRKNVQQLMVLANRGRGGLAAILWVGGFFAALIGLCATIVGFIKGVSVK